MEKYILILGAGLMQRPSIEAARELGYKTLVIDANPKALCVPLADRFEQIDLKDKEKIAEFALKNKDSISAVFTAGTDFSTSVSYAAQKCGLPSHSFEACLNASNKILMRECFKKYNVPSPDFIQISEEDLKEFDEKKIAGLVFPKVIKPCDNMGARGCRLIRNKEEFLPAVYGAVKYSRTKTAILEDYMEGPEFSIDSIVHNGQVTITGFADRHIYFPPYFIELGHTMPSNCSKEIYNQIVKVFTDGVHALGLTEGVAKGDVKYTKNGAMIGEIAARLSGGYMSGWTFPYASDFNLTKDAMRIALGMEPQASGNEVECSKASAERAWISIPGTVEKIYGFDDAKNTAGIKNVFPRTNAGDEADFPRNNVEKCGNVISLCPDYESASKASETAVSKIVLRLKKNNPKTKAFLEGIEEENEKGFPYSAYSMKKIDVNSDEKDFNYRTVAQTLSLYKKITGQEPPLDSECFTNYLLRGGIQGALYYYDSQN